MADQGDDCYFYYYSTCTKGDTCPFRHCEAAMGNETVCNLWQEGRCFRTVCKFRHMEITKKRKEIPCYWENHPAGCQKPHCAFYHEKSRLIDGVFVPPDKSLSKNEEQQQQQQQQQQQEEPAPPPATPLPTAANPQLRGVKTESQEPVPSPTHPPVVINPADDDEDEDDQFSEEGEDGKVGPSPRKLPKSDDSLNFGVSTLEEIRLRKALKASMRRSDVPLQCADASANGEKENILSFFAQPVLQESGRSRGSVADRLGRRMPHRMRAGEDVPLKRSLAERLGGIVDEDQSPAPPVRGLRSIKERLESAAAPTAAGGAGAQSIQGSKKAPEKIRIKTLEEIRKEKAAKSHNSKDPSLQGPPETAAAATERSPPNEAKRADGTAVKTFSEVLLAKKRAAGKLGEKANSPGPNPEPSGTAQVRVKTLEEIRKEKAARSGAQPAQEASDNSKCEENGAKKPRLQRVKKGPSHAASSADDGATQRSCEEADKPERAPSPAPSGNIKVKTFEEIMREKRLRQQEAASPSGAQDPPSAQAEPSHKPSSACALKRRVASKPAPVPPEAPVPLSPHLGQSHPAGAADQIAESGRVPPNKRPRTAPLGPAAEGGAEASLKQQQQQQQQQKSPQHTTDTKGRPKLNVKPSVVKPALQLKPTQKRRGGGRSAVAAVRPLNSAPAGPQEPPPETQTQDKQALLSPSPEAQVSPGAPISPSTSLTEDRQRAPCFRQNPNRDVKLAAAAACSVPQSPTLKSPNQTKPRKQSVGASRSSISASSAVDDFEELMNEFADDHLEEDVDPGIGEDDLLQELSDMIDS